MLAIGGADEADRITAVALNLKMKGKRFAFNGHQISIKIMISQDKITNVWLQMKWKMAADRVLKRFSRQIRKEDAPKSLGFRRRSVGCFSRRSEPDWRAARRVALKMGRLLRCSSVTYRSIRRAVACSWQAIRRKWANTRETGRVRKRVECPEQATARRMGQICSFLPPRRRPILNATKPKGFRRRCTSPITPRRLNLNSEFEESSSCSPWSPVGSRWQ